MLKLRTKTKKEKRPREEVLISNLEKKKELQRSGKGGHGMKLKIKRLSDAVQRLIK